MDINSNSRAIVFDDTIVNDIFTCFMALKEFTGDVYIKIDNLLQSDNIKLKKYVINHGVFQDNITIIDGLRKIVIINQPTVNDIYNEIKNLYNNTLILTSSVNVQLHSKINKMNCELYHVNIDDLSNVMKNSNRVPIQNQFMFDNNNSNILSRYIGNNWIPTNTIPIYGISPINVNQSAYLNLLADDSISLVMCIGQAGTGKTFLACLAGIYKTYDLNKYEEILITRATVNIGENSIGFLPGSKEEKMAPWVQPIKENLKTVLNKKNMINSHCSQTNFNNLDNLYCSQTNLNKYIDPYDDSSQLQYLSRKISKKNKKRMGNLIKRASKSKLNNDMDDSKIKIECISFFRGRTLDNSYCIIDECQNLTSHEIKTIITRIGKNSKLIMIGDDSQSDLKSQSNAFANSIYKMCDNKNVGIIKLNETVRSDLAKLAVKML